MQAAEGRLQKLRDQLQAAAAERAGVRRDTAAAHHAGEQAAAQAGRLQQTRQLLLAQTAAAAAAAASSKVYDKRVCVFGAAKRLLACVLACVQVSSELPWSIALKRGSSGGSTNPEKQV